MLFVCLNESAGTAGGLVTKQGDSVLCWRQSMTWSKEDLINPHIQAVNHMASVVWRQVTWYCFGGELPVQSKAARLVRAGGQTLLPYQFMKHF